MMITNKVILNEYMKFLLNILANYCVDKNKPNKFNLRREGWISEFMFGAWLIYKNYSINFCNIKKFNKNLVGAEFITKGINQQVSNV